MQPTPITVVDTKAIPSGTGAQVRLILQNASEEDMETSLPEAWRHSMTACLLGPGIEEHSWAPFPSALEAPAEPLLTILAEAESGASFSIPGSRLIEPGKYRVSAVLAGPTNPILFPEAEIVIEGIYRSELVVSSTGYLDEYATFQACVLLATNTAVYLKRGTVALSDRTGLPRFTAEGSLIALPASARSLTIAGEPANLLVWLSAGSLCAGAMSYIFVRAAIDLPAAPQRILATMIPCVGGILRTGVLSTDGRQLWIVDIHPVSEEEAPVQVSEAEDEGWPDSSPEPRLPAPVISGDLRLPETALGVAIASPGPESATAVAFTAASSLGLEVWFAPTIEAATRGDWRTIRLDRAAPLPGSDPLLTPGENGVMHLSLLLTTARDGGQFGRLGLVHLAFTDSGQPLIAPGLGWEDLGALPAVPLTSTLRVRESGEGAPIESEWCIAFAGNRTWAKQSSRPITQSTLLNSITRPLTLISQENRLSVVIQDAADFWFTEV